MKPLREIFRRDQNCDDYAKKLSKHDRLSSPKTMTGWFPGVAAAMQKHYLSDGYFGPALMKNGKPFRTGG